MFAAPEFIEAKPVEMLGQFQITLKLQSWVFADWVMRCQECAEPNTRHQEFLALSIHASSAASHCPVNKSPLARRWQPLAMNRGSNFIIFCIAVLSLAQ